MKTKRIVITGGPGTGKTALIKTLETQGFYCFHEVIRDMTIALKKEGTPTAEMVNPIASAKDPKVFNDHLIAERLKHFKAAKKLNKEFVFYDRGIPDVLAYMDYFNQTYSNSYSKICSANPYDMVLALPPWKEIYVQDNERMENFEQATAIHSCIINSYCSFGYEVINIPTGTIEERLHFVQNLIKTNLEKEN